MSAEPSEEKHTQYKEEVDQVECKEDVTGRAEISEMTVVAEGEERTTWDDTDFPAELTEERESAEPPDEGRARDLGSSCRECSAWQRLRRSFGIDTSSAMMMSPSVVTPKMTLLGSEMTEATGAGDPVGA